MDHGTTLKGPGKKLIIRTRTKSVVVGMEAAAADIKKVESRNHRDYLDGEEGRVKDDS